MLDHAITLKDLVESRQRTTAVDHVILRDDLEPVDRGLLFEDVGVMRNPQTDTYPVIREPVESVGWHMIEEEGPARAGGSPGRVITWGWSRRWRRRLCLCRSFCPTPSWSRRHCPCTSSCPCSRAFRYPSCPRYRRPAARRKAMSRMPEPRSRGPWCRPASR